MQCMGIESLEFSSLVAGHEISLTAESPGRALNFPTGALPLAHEQEMAAYKFDPIEKYDELLGRPVLPTEIITTASLNLLHSVLHYFITHVFLPGSESLDVVNQLDLWVISNALAGRKLDYSHLLFGCMIRASSDEYSGSFPFGGYISLLLANLYILLDGYIFKETSVLIHAALIMRHYVIPRRPSEGAVEVVLVDAKEVAAQVSRARKRSRMIQEGAREDASSKD
ncbi:unnamed protein product [Linum trigynum]|uniref:Uncharacterized protein n=1 Tax=Linum trigynum TaxID=586398 RepID=A0AAV2FB17_9ROSI